MARMNSSAPVDWMNKAISRHLPTHNSPPQRRRKHSKEACISVRVYSVSYLDRRKEIGGERVGGLDGKNVLKWCIEREDVLRGRVY